jgi:aminoglycoside 3-N-acetyltransferase I
MTYNVRTLTLQDAGALAALNAVFSIVFEDPQSYASRPPGEAYLARLLGSEHFIAVVASVDEAILGGLTAYQLDKCEQDRREIYIYDLAVLEGHRRKGVATALIRELQRVASLRDAYVIFVQADLVDAPAIALYESLGTKETAHHFDIDVPRQLPAASQSSPFESQQGGAHGPHGQDRVQNHR